MAQQLSAADHRVPHRFSSRSTTSHVWQLRASSPVASPGVCIRRRRPSSLGCASAQRLSAPRRLFSPRSTSALSLLPRPRRLCSRWCPSRSRSRRLSAPRSCTRAEAPPLSQRVFYLSHSSHQGKCFLRLACRNSCEVIDVWNSATRSGPLAIVSLLLNDSHFLITRG